MYIYPLSRRVLIHLKGIDHSKLMSAIDALVSFIWLVLQKIDKKLNFKWFLFSIYELKMIIYRQESVYSCFQLINEKMRARGNLFVLPTLCNVVFSSELTDSFEQYLPKKIRWVWFAIIFLEIIVINVLVQNILRVCSKKFGVTSTGNLL